MAVQIRISEESLSSDIALVPEDTYGAELTNIVTKLAKSSKAPVSYFIWTLNTDPVEPFDEDEFPDLQGSTVGKKLLDNYSLKENAVWRLNAVFKTITGENLPTDQDYDLEGWNEMLKERCLGFSGKLKVSIGDDDKGNAKNIVDTVVSTSQRNPAGSSGGRKKGKR